MRTRYAAVVLLAAACAPAAAQSQLQNAFPNLSFTQLVDLQTPDDGTDRLFSVEQAGVIRVFPNDPATPSAPVFLDIQDRVESGGERGLLGLAFSPNYAADGVFYVFYTAASPLRSVLARFSVMPGDPDAGDPNSEAILLEVPQPAGNHNGGQLAFGPDDGYLYVALGDGGGGGDPGEHGQNPGTLLGALLRIDVAGTGGLAPDCGAGPNADYAIPADNPLADGPGGACDEIWAYGLRNPWRFSFDPPTGALWLGDVGQDAFEEIDVVAGGGNYGWNTMEGFACFDPPTNCDTAGLALPVWAYPHGGSQSVTGGYVYRGPSVPHLLGRYVYADFIDGRIWALDYDGTTAANELLLDTGLNIAAFGTDAAGELYLLHHGGSIRRFAPTAAFPIALKKLIVTAGGTKKVKITWDPADVATGKLDVYVDEAPDGSALKRTANDGAAKVKLKTADFPGDGPFALFACEKKSTAVCSNVITVDFTGVPIDFDEPEDDPEEDGAGAQPAALAEAVTVHPNPFNPQTTITFALRRRAPVTLEVFDALGRKVATLLDGPVAAGTHTAVFEAGGLPSGLYLYRLRTGGSVSVGRMLLFR